jgi:ribosomal protein L24E
MEKKVRRVRKSSSSASVSSPSARKKSLSGKSFSGKSLSGFIENEDELKPKLRRSSSVAGDQLAISKESSLTGEVYVRADGKKVRRVRKSSTSDENVEIITRPDGTKARRIRKTKPEGDSALPLSRSAESTTSTEPSRKKVERSLSGFFNNDESPNAKPNFSGSHSVAGDQHAEGEIYIRADGKKVRRVRKVRPIGDTGSGTSLSGFLVSDAALKPKINGAATVVGDSHANTETSDKPESEIYVRPDGKVSENLIHDFNNNSYIVPFHCSNVPFYLFLFNLLFE